MFNKHNYPPDDISSHILINQALEKDSEAVNSGLFKIYKSLYYDSRDARYKCKEIRENRLILAISKHEKIKQLIKSKV